MNISDNPAAIRALLEEARTIALVGASPNPERDAHKIGRYLLDHGYEVLPVNPGQAEVFGLPCYPDLRSLPKRVDVVNVFRRSDALPAVVDQVLEIRPKALWTQLGVAHPEATRRAEEAGITLVVDRCIRVAHTTLLKPRT